MPRPVDLSTDRECQTRNYLDLAPTTPTMNRHRVGALYQTDCRVPQTGFQWVGYSTSAGSQESFRTPRGVFLQQRNSPRNRCRL